MEELRSTEALDREILEDARKKADKALRNAEQAAAEAEQAWGRRLSEDLAALERKHADRLASKRAETDARLPLDQRRIRAERSERLLREAAEKVLRALPRERILAVLERELTVRSGELPSAGLAVRCSALSDAEVSDLMGRALPGAQWSMAAVQAGEGGGLPRLIVEGGRTVVRVDLAEAGDALLRDRRAELAQALLGTEVLGD